ncbi:MULTISPECIES: P27 family phage terminase small subunit [unclassified Breznakia]|uniref:P27 family phage terminase small subunit n=1 Tax=unclassified Breznakia TaxID=2623764 RepID=UPI0024749698|nr:MULTISPECIES: P27 family phage terminase small subunit [unclassified Breznakia]MDH6367143.1 hypothetical protein [Breznakia sp. PH1-1]MDH6404270.1 hypothetical protein [Breznakia sp. PF1-11]MDH6412031.1 hypothetical protein [Breznakia sp. PFB1-11]MDH6414258.1 hypothetical protein [Breznakia sp. PFB1-14]MDH6416645.1 hypothetical protein [Breznakia sp. PFB1-4]
MAELTTKQIKNRTVRYMKKLGTYRKEYDDLINIYADLIYQYNIFLDRLELENYEVEVETKSGQTKKSGTATYMEVLRKDIGTYSDRLGLNFKARKDSDNGNTKVSKLEETLLKIGKV